MYYSVAPGMSRLASHVGAFSPDPQSLFLFPVEQSVFFCYVDESGTPDIPGNTSHFVLAGLTMPVEQWRIRDIAISQIKAKYGLETAEIHVAWMMRAYPEQDRIPGFEAMDSSKRRSMVNSARTAELHRLLRTKNSKLHHQTKKNFAKTDAYIHLTRKERIAIVVELATTIAGWGDARLFAECIDKPHFLSQTSGAKSDEQAFEQIVSRFEQYLKNISKTGPLRYGLLIHDNNQTVARRHTELMKHFHINGTLWTGIQSIIETPLYVDSQLTSMVQLADLCAYALRRYLENQESALFDLIFQRADRIGTTVVGVRHFTNLSCTCKICAAHRRPTQPTR